MKSSCTWYNPENYFDVKILTGGPLEPLFAGVEYAWDILGRLSPFIRDSVRGNVSELRNGGDFVTRAVAIVDGKVVRDVHYELGDPSKGELKVWQGKELLPGAALVMAGVVLVGDEIEIGAGALVESGALIKAPSIIGANSEVRQGAYVRGGVMSSPGAIIGHATEVKNALFLPKAKAGHFAYVGDSILGREVNLGAGTRLANLKFKPSPYVFEFEGQRFIVEERKFGAIVGDHTETGCNTVINPGTLLGTGARSLPNSTIGPGYRTGLSFLER